MNHNTLLLIKVRNGMLDESRHSPHTARVKYTRYMYNDDPLMATKATHTHFTSDNA